MIPPRGLKAEVYPLRHRIEYACALSLVTANMNSCFLTLVRHTSDLAQLPSAVNVNPHNTAYQRESGPAVAKMSILDKLSLSLTFNLTERCVGGEYQSGVFGDNVTSMHFTWRPVFFSFGEKLDAADDDTGTTVATILGLTKDATFEDIVPITTNKLPVQGDSDQVAPMSTVNIAEVYTDYNMTTDTTMEDHPWDEDLFLDALRRFTNKGALKACVGRTRHVTLTHARPYKKFFLDKFVPKAIRRVVPYTFMGIQVNVPIVNAPGQHYFVNDLTASVGHLGIKAICNYHEWHADHIQDMT